LLVAVVGALRERSMTPRSHDYVASRFVIDKRCNEYATNVRNDSVGDPFVRVIRVLSLLVAGG
jgi:hypothetical protein